jgi:hypothetical protein
MPARVNLNVPSRLIESARAAQYANREALGGRTLADKIKAKARVRRDAALRAQPLPPDQAGEAPEGRDPLKWRIWRKRRPFRPVDVGVAWLHIGKNYTLIANEIVDTETVIPYEHPEEGIIGPWTVGDTYTNRKKTTRSASASLELVVTVGARSGERWKQFRHSLTFTLTSADTFEETWTKINGPNDIFGNPTNFIEKNDRSFGSGTSNFFLGLWWNMLPAGQSDMILVVSIAQYHRNYAYERLGSGPLVFSPNNFTIQNTTHTCFLVTESDVVELTQPLPAFMQKKIDSVPAEYAAGQTTYGYDILVYPLIPIRLAVPQPAIGVYQVNHPSPYVATELSLSQPAASPYRIVFNSVSSVVYESIAPDGTFGVVSAQQAKTSYAEYSGNPEIPVLGYKRDDPSAASTPKTERGVFGIITGASVTEPVTPEMLALGLEDELEQVPGPDAANQPEPVQMVAAYDYHGGSYCRDRLELLGIDVP